MATIAKSIVFERLPVSIKTYRRDLNSNELYRHNPAYYYHYYYRDYYDYYYYEMIRLDPLPDF